MQDTQGLVTADGTYDQRDFELRPDLPELLDLYLPREGAWQGSAWFHTATCHPVHRSWPASEDIHWVREVPRELGGRVRGPDGAGHDAKVGYCQNGVTRRKSA